MSLVSCKDVLVISKVFLGMCLLKMVLEIFIVFFEVVSLMNSLIYRWNLNLKRLVGVSGIVKVWFLEGLREVCFCGRVFCFDLFFSMYYLVFCYDIGYLIILD